MEKSGSTTEQQQNPTVCDRAHGSGHLPHLVPRAGGGEVRRGPRTSDETCVGKKTIVSHFAAQRQEYHVIGRNQV